MPVRVVDAGPPERLALHAVGRHARLDLAFETRGRRTVVAHQYAEPPLRIGRVFDLDGAAYVILVCTGPGVFGGDLLTQSIRVGSGARVVLTSQSALQVHPSPQIVSAAGNPPRSDSARLHCRYQIDRDAELHCHWDPVIPFAGAVVDQRFDIDAAEDSRLYWSDAVLAGRVCRGEAWQFAALHHALTLRIAARTAYLERYAVVPRDRAPQRTWMGGVATHFGTTLVRHPAATRETVEQLHRRLADIAGIAAGVDAVEPALAVARLTTADGASFGRARASYRAWTLASIFGRPELAGRK